MAVKSEHIIDRQGKSFVLYAGLLDEAHQQGLKSIRTKLLQVPTADNAHVAICFAEVETERGTFTGIGDASPENVSRLMVSHIIRFSETRAKARALRDAINVGMVALEELGEEPEPEPATEKQVSFLHRLASERKGWNPSVLDEELIKRYGTTELSKADASEMIDWLSKQGQSEARRDVDRETGEIRERAAQPGSKPQPQQPPPIQKQPPAPQPPQSNGASTGNGATPAQVRAIYLIARDQHGLSEAQVEERSMARYGCLPSELSKRDASAFITELKR